MAPSSPEFCLSADLVHELVQWAADYDSTLHMDDPLESGFSSESAENEFVQRGKTIALRLRRELDSDWSVTYFDGKLHRDLVIAEGGW